MNDSITTRAPLARQRTVVQRAVRALVCSAAVVTGLVIFAQLWTRDLGMDERLDETARVVSEVDPRGAAARAGIVVGDEVLSAPGLDTSRTAERTEREAFASAYHLGRALERGSVPVRLRNAGGERTVEIVPDREPSLSAALRQLRRLGSQLPVTFAFLGVAVLLAWRTARVPRDERARIDIALSFALLGSAWVETWPAPGWPVWLFPLASFLENFGTTFGVALLARFAWSYPTRSRLVDRRGVRLVVIGVGLLCAAFSFLDVMHVVSAPPGLHGNTVNSAFTGTLGLATLVGLVWQRTHAVDRIARRQATWLLAFCGIGIFVPTALFVVPQYGLGLSLAPILNIALLPFPLLIPIGFAAVVTRYRLFSLDGIGLRAIPYAIAVVTSLVVCLAVTLGLDAALASYTGTGEASRWLGTTAALVLVEPLRRSSQVLIDRAFARDRDDFLRRCAELASELAPMSDASAVEAAVCDALDAKAVRLTTLEELVGETGAAAIHEELARSGAVRFVDLRDLSSVDALRERGLELLVAVPSARGGDARVLALTLPGDVLRVTRAERAALALVGKVVGAALARDEAWRMLEMEILRGEAERRQIAMELHDGIGATLTAAQFMARRLRAPASSTEDRTLDALDAALRDGIGDLKASLSGLDPTEASWEALVANLRRHAGEHCAAARVAFTLESQGDVRARLSAAGRLAVLRVVQEAVCNAVKHASPRRVDVTMALAESGLEITVEDDGGGGATSSPEGRGLGNMVRRVASLAGELHVSDVQPHGTRVAMSLPASTLVLPSAPSGETSRSKLPPRPGARPTSRFEA